MSKESKFWMVYGHGRGAPAVRHHTKESAHAEASRLAANNPGSLFVVLKATKGYRADLPQIKSVKLEDADFQEIDRRIPF